MTGLLTTTWISLKSARRPCRSGHSGQCQKGCRLLPSACPVCRTCRPCRDSERSRQIAGRRSGRRWNLFPAEIPPRPWPRAESPARQQNKFNQRHGDFNVAGGMAFHARVIRLGIALVIKAEERVGKVNDPADEQRDHQPVDVDDQIVHVLAVFRSQRGSRQFEPVPSPNLFCCR